MNEKEDELSIDVDSVLALNFIFLKNLCESKKKKIKSKDLERIFESYGFLLAERSKYRECEKKLVSISNFMGLR